MTTVPVVPASSTELPCPVCGEPGEVEDRFGPAPLLRCTACSFTYLHGPTDPSLYGDDYFAGYVGGDYLAEEHQRRRESRRRLELLHAVAPPPGHLLEIGAAAGFFLDESRTRGYEGVGVEPNAAMAAHARETLGLDVRTGMLEDTKLPHEAFDVACAFHVVEHIEAPLAALQVVRELLRPGGHVMVEVPNAESAAARRRGADWPLLDLPYHVGHHGPRSLRTLLERAGFEPLRLDTVPFAFYGGASPLDRLARGLAEAARSRVPSALGPHPHAHQLLRAVARRPA